MRVATDCVAQPPLHQGVRCPAGEAISIRAANSRHAVKSIQGLESLTNNSCCEQVKFAAGANGSRILRPPLRGGFSLCPDKTAQRFCGARRAGSAKAFRRNAVWKTDLRHASLAWMFHIQGARPVGRTVPPRREHVLAPSLVGTGWDGWGAHSLHRAGRGNVSKSDSVCPVASGHYFRA